MHGRIEELTEEPTQAASLTSSALWIMAAKTTAFALSFALPLLLVRRLEQHEFGLYKQVFLVINTAITVLPMGFAISAFYFLPREPEKRRQVVLNILLFNATVGALACAALALRPSLLGAVFRSEEIVTYGPAVGVVILLWVIGTFLEFVALAYGETKLATAFIVTGQFTKTALLVSAALLYGTVESLIYAALAQSALQTLILLVYLNSRFRGFWRSFEWETMRRQLAYAMPLGLAGMIYYVQLDLHNYVVSYRFDSATFAIYAIGCFQLPLFGILLESVGSVMIPRVSVLQQQGDRHEVIRLTARAMRKMAAVLFPAYAFLFVTGREFISFLFTEQYAASVPIFLVNLTIVPFSVLVLDPILRAYAEHRYFLLKLRPALIVILFAALWYGTARFGLLGAITAVVCVTIAERLLTAFKVARIIGLTRGDLALFTDVCKLAAAAAAAGLGAAALRFVLLPSHPLTVLAACGICFALIFLLAVWLFGIVTDSELRLIHGRAVRLQRRVFWKRAVDPLA